MSKCLLKIESMKQKPSPCANNKSGVREVYFIPKEDVETINAIKAENIESFSDAVTIGKAEMKTHAVTVKSGKHFAVIKSGTNIGLLKYTPTENSAQCRVFKSELQMFYPGFKRTLLGFLSIANNTDFLLIVKLENGQYHLIGDEYHGAEIADGTEATSGKAASDDNGANINLDYIAPAINIFYDGWNPEDPINGIELFRIANILSTEDGSFIANEKGQLIEI